MDENYTCKEKTYSSLKFDFCIIYVEILVEWNQIKFLSWRQKLWQGNLVKVFELIYNNVAQMILFKMQQNS